MAPGFGEFILCWVSADLGSSFFVTTYVGSWTGVWSRRSYLQRVTSRLGVATNDFVAGHLSSNTIQIYHLSPNHQFWCSKCNENRRMINKSNILQLRVRKIAKAAEVSRKRITYGQLYRSPIITEFVAAARLFAQTAASCTKERPIEFAVGGGVIVSVL